jgi:hypothetical protein
MLNKFIGMEIPASDSVGARQVNHKIIANTAKGSLYGNIKSSYGN